MMTFRIPNQEKINRFWQWFKENAEQLRTLAKTDRATALKKIDGRLKSLNRLIIPIIRIHDEEVELILSADSIEPVFLAVEQIIAQAPQIPGWRFTAFMPPEPHVRYVQVEDKQFDIDDFCFRLQKTNSNPAIIDVFVRNYNQLDYYKYLNAAFQLIKLLLGEYASVKAVGKINVSAWEPGIDCTPLKNLPEQF